MIKRFELFNSNGVAMSDSDFPNESISAERIHQICSRALWYTFDTDFQQIAKLCISHEQLREDVRCSQELLQQQNVEILRLTSALASVRSRLEDVVCTVGVDKGVVLLSEHGPTHYDPDLNCQVYDHEYFSPLGDALIAIYDLTEELG
jgi:hypothetical protein